MNSDRPQQQQSIGERYARPVPTTIAELIAEWRFEASVIGIGPIGVPQAQIMLMCAGDLERLDSMLKARES